MKTENMKKLIELHDKLKNHPFREHFDECFRADYRITLREVSATYSNYMYHDDCTDLGKESSLWNHNYNACLSLWYMYGKDYDWLIPYYDQMLGVIHRFIETEEYPPVVYNLLHRDRKSNTWETVPYYLVTKENSPFDCACLPGYYEYRTDLRYDITEEEVYEEYRRNFTYVTEEKLHQWAHEYVTEKLPIYKWIQETKRGL